MTIDATTGGKATADINAARPKRQRQLATGRPTTAQQPTTVTTAKPPSKSVLVIKLLSRAPGATAAEIGEPTGWQPHSVRSYLTGLRKKGLTVIREQRRTGETTYRIVATASATADAEVTLAADKTDDAGALTSASTDAVLKSAVTA